MSLEFVNRICPNCKNSNYMVSLGDFATTYKYKCMNCNRYFNDIDFEKEQLQPVWKSDTIKTWSDTMIDEKINQLIDEADRVIKEKDKKIMEINTQIAELQREKIRRGR